MRPVEGRPIRLLGAAFLLAALGGCAAGQATDAWAQRVLAYTPYDGHGRYTMDEDDGVRGIQGLRELASRFGVKPYGDLLLPGDIWQTERVVFSDVDTGATVVRLTNDPWTDQLSYFQGNWSADGKYIVFRRRPGMWESSTDTHGPMAMNADATRLQNVFRDHRMVRKEVCSPVDPGICYAMSSDRKLVAFDLETGQTHRVLRGVERCWHLKVSLDGRHLMGHARTEEGRRFLWVVRSDGGDYREIAIPAPIHDSYQFHPSQRKIMYWYEGRYRTEGFVQRALDGGDEAKVPALFDWNHGDVGPDRGVHTGGYITRIEGDTWRPKEVLFHQPGEEYYDKPHTYNGYLTWWPKDQLWVYSTRIVQRPHMSEVHCFHAEPVPGDVVNRYRICYTGVRRPGCLDNPGASPDGTKVLLNSNMLGSVDAYYVVARLPEPPLGLQAERSAEGVRLTWQPPTHHAETAGYHVYRGREGGAGYVPLTNEPVTSTGFVDREAPAGAPFYVVSSVEHSGLESGLSDEACPPDVTGAPRRIFMEAEAGERSLQMWLALQGLASGLHYVWMRGREGEGTITLPVSVPPAGEAWIVWARLRGPAGGGQRLSASAGDETVTLRAPGVAEWRWATADGALPLTLAVDKVVLSSATYGVAIDCLVLTDDPGFSPAKAERIRWPELPDVHGVRADAVSPYSVRVSWDELKTPRLRHYNLYCSPEEGGDWDQSALVASPDRNTHLDWGLKAGSTLFYRVSCVDRAGHESPLSTPVGVTLPDLEPATLTEQGADRVRFAVPRDGTYVLWLKLRNGGSGGVYITVEVDGEGGGCLQCRVEGRELALGSHFSGSFGRGGREPEVCCENIL